MALIIEIKVIPCSKKQYCELDSEGIIKCRLKSVPEAGKANMELLKMMSKGLKVSVNDIAIISGATARNKLVKINADITFEYLLKALDIEKQMRI